MRKQFSVLAFMVAVYCIMPVAALSAEDFASDEWEAILKDCKVDHAIAQRCMKEATDSRFSQAANEITLAAIGTKDATNKLVKMQIAKDGVQLAAVEHPLITTKLLRN
jgi:hypothetical protein